MDDTLNEATSTIRDESRRYLDAVNEDRVGENESAEDQVGKD